jgi:hypothetical protein
MSSDKYRPSLCSGVACWSLLMRREGKSRHPASRKVIALREAMGLTQAQFAKDILQCAWGSVARWETTHPPRGDALLRFFDVAECEALSWNHKANQKEGTDHVEAYKKWDRFLNLAHGFLALYYEDLLETVPRNFVTVGVSRWEDSHAYLLAKVWGLEGIVAAESLLSASDALQSKNPVKRDAAKAALKQFARAVAALKQLPDEMPASRKKELTEAVESLWQSTDAVKRGGSSSSSAGSKSASRRTPGAGRPR